MASDWGPADWTLVGAIDDLPGCDLEVHVRRDGMIALELGDWNVDLSPARRDKLRELLDRAAMPGQPADGEPPAGEAREHG